MDHSPGRRFLWRFLNLPIIVFIAIFLTTSSNTSQISAHPVPTVTANSVDVSTPTAVMLKNSRAATPTSTRTPTPINIGNFVWDDLDDDGRQDTGEPGLSGVKVQLWNPALTIKYDSDKTDEFGHYTVIAPLPGDYRVRVKLLDSTDQFTVKDATDDILDSDINSTGTYKGYTDIISIAPNVISITSIDAGIITSTVLRATETPIRATESK